MAVSAPGEGATGESFDHDDDGATAGDGVVGSGVVRSPRTYVASDRATGAPVAGGGVVESVMAAAAAGSGGIDVDHRAFCRCYCCDYCCGLWWGAQFCTRSLRRNPRREFSAMVSTMVAPSSQSGKLIGSRFGWESRHREAGVPHPNHMGGGPVANDGQGAENNVAAC